MWGQITIVLNSNCLPDGVEYIRVKLAQLVDLPVVIHYMFGTRGKHLKMESSTTTSTPNQTSSSLAILADSNVQDPKPATLGEILGCSFTIHRVTDMPSFLRFTALPGSLNFMVIACLTPLVADYSSTEDADDREMALSKLPKD